MSYHLDGNFQHLTQLLVLGNHSTHTSHWVKVYQERYKYRLLQQEDILQETP